jgi:hypothetical protein
LLGTLLFRRALELPITPFLWRALLLTVSVLLLSMTRLLTLLMMLSMLRLLRVLLRPALILPWLLVSLSRLLAMLLLGSSLLMRALLRFGIVLSFAWMILPCIGRGGDPEKRCQECRAGDSDRFHLGHLHCCLLRAVPLTRASIRMTLHAYFWPALTSATALA